MSGGGGGAPSNPSGGPIDNQQRLQTSPNPSLPPADYSMGYARNFQPPSFFNPFSGYYGANTGMGGFQSQFGGFQPQFGGFGGFGGFQQPQYGGFQQPQYGGFQQPQYGGFQQPQYGGFQQPQFGGLGGFQQPFGGGFGGQSNRFTRRGQEYTQPYMPQPQPQGFGLQPGVMPLAEASDPRSQIATIPTTGNQQTEAVAVTPDQLRGGAAAEYRTSRGGGMGNFGGFNPMMGGGIGAFGGFQRQRDPNQPPPGMKLNPTYNAGYSMADDAPVPGSAAAISKQRFIPV